jgi:hypothetical protein
MRAREPLDRIILAFGAGVCVGAGVGVGIGSRVGVGDSSVVRVASTTAGGNSRRSAEGSRRE